MTTIILGLSALSIVLAYVARVESKRSENRCRELSKAYSRISSEINTNIQLEKKVEKLEKKIESMKQTSSAWILEKEELIERLEQEKFDQMHEFALMLNDSYDVDKVILKKAELHDFMLHNANRNQRRQFIDKGYINL